MIVVDITSCLSAIRSIQLRRKFLPSDKRRRASCEQKVVSSKAHPQDASRTVRMWFYSRMNRNAEIKLCQLSCRLTILLRRCRMMRMLFLERTFNTKNCTTCVANNRRSKVDNDDTVREQSKYHCVSYIGIALND